LPYDHYSPNDDAINSFPERIERFLEAITQIYFQQDSSDTTLSGNNKAQGKTLLANYEMEMMKKKANNVNKEPVV